ncbi:MAG TPA: 1-acyl-sn-glycerol-3-phosphate acyltransferase, partial [Polyangiaceae bacterium]|nr:1-acyl-sn-glycerol-3-phosphate acyltransferase [Polyangiaceae bacterium]
MNRQKIANAVLTPADWVLDRLLQTIRQREVFDRISSAAYNTFGGMMRTQFEWLNELAIEGAENVPASGGLVMASNHQSWLDVQVLTASCPRRVHFVAKMEFK